MTQQEFTLILGGVPEITSELADALYTVMDGSIELGMREGVAFLDVTRRAWTLNEAITTAIQAVEGAGVGVRVIRVERRTT
jgi:hypothetical protein